MLKNTTAYPVEAYFGFTKQPFPQVVASADMMEYPGQKELLARLKMAVRDQSIALITGQGGLGKSTSLRKFRESLDPNRYNVLAISNPAPGLTGVYREMVRRLGHEPSYFKPHLVTQLREALHLQAVRDRQNVILFDEAHGYTDDWLQDLRMMASADLDATHLATLILAGDNTLNERLRMICHEPLRGRIRFRYQLKPFDPAQTKDYVNHHLRIAGYRGEPIFSDGFLARMHEYTRGVPRSINQACLLALMAATLRETRIIDEAIWTLVHTELEQDRA